VPIVGGYTPQAIRKRYDWRRQPSLRPYRYWLASIMTRRSAVPGVLVTRVAAATSTLRVGTGGVMLPYYSPLKVAEQFRMLEALYPGRIDLGIGRAPAGDQRTALAMGEGSYPRAERTGAGSVPSRRISTMTCPPSHPFAKVKACLQVQPRPRSGCSVPPGL
jgi:hypothetical protein